MQIKIGYELEYECPKPTPMLLTLGVHHSRAADLVVADVMRTAPQVPMDAYRDHFGNWCQRLVAPAGRIRISASGVIRDQGLFDAQVFDAVQHPIPELPASALEFLLGSRYCETDRLVKPAWELFSDNLIGWAKVQRICDYVHNHVEFGYEYADPTQTAFEVFQRRRGVCRDFAHLGVALCRCMNIPARYCMGYISDIGFPGPHAPMDFAAWMEVYLGGAWHTFDPRNNTPRAGRILIARGRDAADVALTTAFGENTLVSFEVVTEQIAGT